MGFYEADAEDCPLCGAAQTACCAPEAPVRINFQEWGKEMTERAQPKTVLLARDVYEDFLLPGTRQLGRRLVGRRGQRVTLAEAQRYRVLPVEPEEATA